MFVLKIFVCFEFVEPRENLVEVRGLCSNLPFVEKRKIRDGRGVQVGTRSPVRPVEILRRGETGRPYECCQGPLTTVETGDVLGTPDLLKVQDGPIRTI